MQPRRTWRLTALLPRLGAACLTLALAVSCGAQRQQVAPTAVRLDTLTIVDTRAGHRWSATHYGVNPTVDAAEEPVVALGLEADTASWMLSRASLAAGHMPAPSVVRVEEFVAAFQPLVGEHAAAGGGDASVGMTSESQPSLTRPGYDLIALSIHIRRPRLAAIDAVVLWTGRDVSPAITASLAEALAEQSRVPVVNAAPRLLDALAAATPRRPLVLVTSGHDGLNDPQHLQALAATTARGATVSIVGAASTREGRLNDALLHQLAESSGGPYTAMASPADAPLSAAHVTPHLVPTVRDATLSVTFDPAVVSRYRLVGYESRRLSRGDAGESCGIGASLGGGVTVLFEVRRVPERGQQSTALAEAVLSYRSPGGPSKSLRTPVIPGHGGMGLRRLSIVAAFAEKLRGSYWAREITYSQLREWVAGDGIDEPSLRRAIGQAELLDTRPDPLSGATPTSGNGQPLPILAPTPASPRPTSDP